MNTKTKKLPNALFGALPLKPINFDVQAALFCQDDDRGKVTFQFIYNRNAAVLQSYGITSKDFHAVAKKYFLDGNATKMTLFAKNIDLFQRKGHKTQNIGVKVNKINMAIEMFILLHAQTSNDPHLLALVKQPKFDWPKTILDTAKRYDWY